MDIRGPNTDGDVWLFVDTPHRHHGFNLGRLRAGLYILRRGSKIAVIYGAAGEADLVESKVSEGRMTFWFNGADALEVTIAGAETQPVDQYEWLGGKREHS